MTDSVHPPIPFVEACGAILQDLQANGSSLDPALVAVGIELLQHWLPLMMQAALENKSECTVVATGKEFRRAFPKSPSVCQTEEETRQRLETLFRGTSIKIRRLTGLYEANKLVSVVVTLSWE